MAKGDVVSDLQDIANAANLDYQPAAGVEVMVQAFSAENNSAHIKLYNGTLNASTVINAVPYGAANDRVSKILINNTRYLRMTNNSGVNNELGFTGVQTK